MSSIFEDAPAHFPADRATLLSTFAQEQCLVGTLLNNNKRLDVVADTLRPEHFSDPRMGRIYGDILRNVARGDGASVVSLRAGYEADGFLHDLGGPEKLAALLQQSWPPTDLRQFAKQIVDRWKRRGADEIAEDLRRALIEGLETDEADSLLADAAAGLAGVAAEGAGDPARSAQDAAQDLLRDMERAVTERPKSRAVTTGLRDLDRLLRGGLHPGRMIVVGARTGIGKSMLAGSIALSAARAGVASGVFSLEMPVEDWRVRLLSNLSGIPGARLSTDDAGAVTAEEWDALRGAVGSSVLSRVQIIAGQEMTAADVKMRAQALVRREKVGLLVVDYLGLLKAPQGMAKEGLVAITSHNSTAMKRMAVALDVPVVVVAQLNRDLESREDPRPTLADLKWSGSIEQDADLVMLLHRAEAHLERNKPVRRDRESEEKFAERLARHHDDLERERGRMDVFVAKHRHGKRGHIRVAVDDDLARISDVLREVGA